MFSAKVFFSSGCLNIVAVSVGFLNIILGAHFSFSVCTISVGS